jgi:hypothetical protein
MRGWWIHAALILSGGFMIYGGILYPGPVALVFCAPFVLIALAAIGLEVSE